MGLLFVSLRLYLYAAASIALFYTVCVYLCVALVLTGETIDRVSFALIYIYLSLTITMESFDF